MTRMQPKFGLKRGGTRRRKTEAFDAMVAWSFRAVGNFVWGRYVLLLRELDEVKNIHGHFVDLKKKTSGARSTHVKINVIGHGSTAARELTCVE